ncbi:MAG: hypothetical protein QOH90_2427, partial [Actinomycetota bacterium]|nr:hypothetical protein [Actinomycetota bacterium]
MRPIKVALLAITVVIGVVGSAAAESVTVQGSGDIKKMVAINGQTAAVTKVFGLGKPCASAQYVSIHVMWGTSEYDVEGACSMQGSWDTGLFYQQDRSNPNAKEVNCPGFTLTYNSTNKSLKAFIPRSCMTKAPNRVKFKSEGATFSAA